jgi:hypothetical protein
MPELAWCSFGCGVDVNVCDLRGWWQRGTAVGSVHLLLLLRHEVLSRLVDHMLAHGIVMLRTVHG